LPEKAGQSGLAGTLTTGLATVGRQHARGIGTGVYVYAPVIDRRQVGV
jgi:hypothetical protein